MLATTQIHTLRLTAVRSPSSSKSTGLGYAHYSPVVQSETRPEWVRSDEVATGRHA